MPDSALEFEPSLKNMSKQEWISEVTDLVGDRGYVMPLGQRHTAAFVKNGPTLLISFETHHDIQTLSPDAHPLGWEMVKSQGWSHLAVISDGDTWFRDSAIYDYFDQLLDDGFFDAFDSVLFYGAGPSGYAACAYSVVAPGAYVLALQPQATLDPFITSWDKRFLQMRRTDFNSRFGYAPDMLEAAMRAYVLFDPVEAEDAMHAALFNCSAVTKYRMRHMGRALQEQLMKMDLLYPLIKAAADGSLTAERFGKLARARRNHLPYLRKLLNVLDSQDRTDLEIALCRNVVTRIGAPRFKKRLRRLTEKAED
ncbi:phosphoadenosine phosphosulfate reductase [Roseobacter sp.]|uniref:phosphoadenosine phosphosulfate reductase n=1 Tax=Roseobacter sp. TaxID=1907202 RepID=UPI00385F379E